MKEFRAKRVEGGGDDGRGGSDKQWLVGGGCVAEGELGGRPECVCVSVCRLTGNKKRFLTLPLSSPSSPPPHLHTLRTQRRVSSEPVVWTAPRLPCARPRVREGEESGSTPGVCQAPVWASRRTRTARGTAREGT